MRLGSVISLMGAWTLANAVIPLTMKNKRFIKPNPDGHVQGEVFFMKGIDYQPGGSSGYDSASGEDALTDVEACYRDAYVFQQLGINTIRIYSLNPDLDHDECVTIFNNAGIFLLLDVNSGEYGTHLNRADPEGTYNGLYLSRVFKFIEAFKNYPNVLGFFSGNEVINDQNNYAEITPKYLRAVQRDMKEYIAAHADRSIPVGYSAADGVELRRATLEYFQCLIDGNEDDNSTSDFFGLNSYEWCSGSSDWTTSGYDKLNSTLSNATIPLIFSEFGCNKNSPRTFDEIGDGLFGGLVNTFSGGLVYEYSQETSDYGVVEINSDKSVTYLEDFEYLKEQYTADSTPKILENDVEDIERPTCDADKITDIYPDFGAEFDLPDQSDEIKDMIDNGVNVSHVGSILDDLTARGSKYTIFDAKSSEVASATVTFDDINKINTQSNTEGSATGTPTSTASSSATSSVSSNSASSSSSKGGAAHNFVTITTGLFGLFVSALTFLI